MNLDLFYEYILIEFIIFFSNDIMPLKRTYKTKATRARKPRLHGGSKLGDRIKADTKKFGDKVKAETTKAGDWFKKAGKFIKDKKLLSSGLKAAAPLLPAVGKPLAGFAAGVVDQL